MCDENTILAIAKTLDTHERTTKKKKTLARKRKKQSAFSESQNDIWEQLK